MKLLTSTLLVCFTLSGMANLFGQSITGNKKTDTFKNRLFINATSNKTLNSNEYTFSKSTGSYQNLSGGVSVNNNQLWDDPEYTIPIGFTFELSSYTLDSIYFGLGVGAVVSTEIDTNYEADFIIIPFGADLIDRGDISGISQSPISYKVEGAAGSRIFKLEWKNAGFYDEADSLNTLNDYVNIQLWLYEGTNDIEFHYGPNMITDASINYYGNTGPYIGMSNYDFTNKYLLSGDPANPVMVDSIVLLNGTPADGTIYKFSKVSTSINANVNTDFNVQVYPNPVQQSAIFKINQGSFQNAELHITDVFGRRVKTMSNLHTPEITFNRDELVNGIYFYQFIENEKCLATGTFMLQY
jgi:hypothetical protein